jgi:hypothetical protein
MTHKVTYDSDAIPEPDFSAILDKIESKGTGREEILKALIAVYKYGYYAGKEHDWWKTMEALEDEHWKD